MDTHDLSRILSCPAGAESTDLQAVEDVKGFSHIHKQLHKHRSDWGARSTKP